ncbi:MAG: ornithine cyclodeaminase family protein [Bacteroidales bacterium]|nr:ornithine cyclodeaminase family protein [Bacteroidales bacterium]
MNRNNIIKDSTGNTIRYVNDSEIRSLVPMTDAISLMEKAFSDYDNGKAVVPPRLVTHDPDDKVTLLVKPAFIKGSPSFGLKLLTQAVNNPAHNLPAMMGMVILFDSETGRIKSMMEAAALTAIRTGAAGGLAAKLLSNQGAETVAIYGCGVQGRTQLEAVCAVRKIKTVLVADTSAKNAREFIADMSSICNARFVLLEKAEMLAQADIICTATNSGTPLFAPGYVKKGVHINAIGSYKPEMQEIDPVLMASSSLWVDDREMCLAESGDLIRPIELGLMKSEHIRGTLGELVNAKIGGRRAPGDITLFKSVGTGIQDLVMAQYIYDKLN